MGPYIGWVKERKRRAHQIRALWWARCALPTLYDVFQAYVRQPCHKHSVRKGYAVGYCLVVVNVMKPSRFNYFLGLREQ